MEQSKNATAELFYNTRPVFFSHNSIDQIHPLDLDRYFTWTKLPKVSLNWINQTEAIINLSIDAITQFKLTNWFHFGDVYFNVMAYKMISQTGNNKVYQYHLKMNIHNTFLPTIFNYVVSNQNDIQSYTTLVKRTNYIYSDVVGHESALKKIDPMLDFKNKNYAIISSCVDYSHHGGLYTLNDITELTQTKEMPNKSFETNNRYLYFIYQNDDNSTGGINYFNERRYKTIKWYVWRNPKSLSYILIPSVADARARLTAVVSKYNRNIVNVINIATGKWKDNTIIENTSKKTFECSNNDDEIEYFLLNGDTTNTDFANQENFVGAFFGPAITGGQWHLFKPLGSNAPAFVCVVTNNNLDIFNGKDASVIDNRNLINCVKYKSTKIYTSLPINTSGNVVVKKDVSRDVVNIDYSAAWSYWILSNIAVGEGGYKVIEPLTYTNFDFKLINLTNIQIANNITATNPYYRTPLSTYTYNYPQTNTVITDTYKQYLNSVRASQDTSMSIAKQQMDLGIAKNVLGGIGGVASGIGQMLNPTNLFNPGKFVEAGANIFNSISGAATGTASEVLAYQNKQKEIDAANLDKQNSIGATVHSSTINDNIQNLIYGRGVGVYEYNIFAEEQRDKTICKLPLMYWTSVLGKLPTTLHELATYSNYLFWYGIYIESRYQYRLLYNAFSLHNINSKNTVGFWYVDMEMPTAILDEIFGNINMDYKLMIQTIFNNGLRLYYSGATPIVLKGGVTSYTPLVEGV